MSLTARVPNSRASSMITGSGGAAGSAWRDVRAGRVSFAAQMSAWRRSLPAIRRNASARRGSFSMPASASYSRIASRSSRRLARLWRRVRGHGSNRYPALDSIR